MERDARRMRNGQPFVFTNLMKKENLDGVLVGLKNMRC